MSDHLLIRGDSRRIPLADESVHCVVTSPPYLGLRDYGTARWEGGEPGCDHRAPDEAGKTTKPTSGQREHAGRFAGPNCWRCGARRVDRQLGLEPDPRSYVDAMVGVMREVRRVLHPSGTLWLNCGDGYSSASGVGRRDIGREFGGSKTRVTAPCEMVRRPEDSTLGPKQLLGIPWTLALALRDDGWWLRSEIIWAKPNPMPESVTDRPTKAHEQVFLLAKSESYFWDAEGVREPMANASAGRYAYAFGGSKSERLTSEEANGPGTRTHPIGNREPGSGRNLRSVWSLATESYPGAHFATFPRALVERCVKAGSSEAGCCPRCGSPWERVVERGDLVPDEPGYKPRGRTRGNGLVKNALHPAGTSQGHPNHHYERSTLGWRPTCTHGLDPVPTTVLDPFIGSGTTIVVANALGRRAMGIDLSAEYLAQARRRIERPHAAPIRPGRAESLPLFDGADSC